MRKRMHPQYERIWSLRREASSDGERQARALLIAPALGDDCRHRCMCSCPNWTYTYMGARARTHTPRHALARATYCERARAPMCPRRRGRKKDAPTPWFGAASVSAAPTTASHLSCTADRLLLPPHPPSAPSSQPPSPQHTRPVAQVKKHIKHSCMLRLRILSASIAKPAAAAMQWEPFPSSKADTSPRAAPHTHLVCHCLHLQDSPRESARSERRAALGLSQYGCGFRRVGDCKRMDLGRAACSTQAQI